MKEPYVDEKEEGSYSGSQDYFDDDVNAFRDADNQDNGKDEERGGRNDEDDFNDDFDDDNLRGQEEHGHDHDKLVAEVQETYPEVNTSHGTGGGGFNTKQCMTILFLFALGMGLGVFLVSRLKKDDANDDRSIGLLTPGPTMSPETSPPSTSGGGGGDIFDKTLEPVATTNVPTGIPTIMPTNATAAPTETNTLAEFISEANMTNFSIALNGVSEMNETAQETFAQVTEKFYLDLYAPGGANLDGRRIQALLGVTIVQIVVIITDLVVSTEGITVIFDMYLQYSSTLRDPPINVILDPFEDPIVRDNFVERLKQSTNPSFFSLTLVILTYAGPTNAPSTLAPNTTTALPTIAPTHSQYSTPPTTPPLVLPNLTLPPASPCDEDSGCTRIMLAIDYVYPSATRYLIEVPGTCQNWARNWLRTEKDILEFSVDRIRQRFALAVIYCEFRGDNWANGQQWLSSLHECDWPQEIGEDPCDSQEQFQSLQLSGHSIRGTIPPEITFLSSLRKINLSDNILTGPIPSEMVKLTKLEVLSLSSNHLRGAVPRFIWQFPDMIHLDVANNFLTGAIPGNVHETAPNLRDLFVENNELGGPIPSTFGQLDWQRLHLADNKFEGRVPRDINSGKMRELMLHNNRLTGELPASSFANEYSGSRSQLEKVTMYDNDMTGDVNEMCILMTDPSVGVLELLAVDLDKVACDCCTGPP